MHPITRRGLLASAGLAAGVFAIGRARGEPRARWHFGSSIAASHPTNTRMRDAAARLLKATDGAFEVTCFPDGALGGDTQMLSQVRAGALQMMDISPLILSTLVPVAAISDTGFAFHDYDKVWPAMDGALGDVVRAGIAAGGLHAFPRIFDNGFRQVTTKTREVRGPEDLRGLKLRVPVSPILVSMFQALGAAPASLNFNEVYTALQTGVVDGQENPLPIIETSKLFEVQKHCALTRHVWDGHWIIANPAAYERLPAELRTALDAEMEHAALAEREEVAALNGSLQQQLAGQGLAFNTPDRDAMRAALAKAGFYDQWRGKFGSTAWSALEAGAGTLG